MQEVIFCASGPASENSSLGSISLNDFTTGTPIFSLKQTGASQQCVAFVETSNREGGFILAAQAEKSILNVYSFQKDQAVSKIVLPEKLSCLAVDPRGLYCAGGTASGRMYLWEISSGILFNAWEAHYRKINVARFSQDGVVLVTGSEDSGLNAWEIARLTDNDLQNDIPPSYYSMTDHTLSVTDIAIGLGAFPTCRVLSSSADCSVKMWDLATQSLLTTFVFPKPIISISMDLTERLFFGASQDGSIHQVNLYRQRKDKYSRGNFEPVGGEGVGESIQIAQEEDASSRLISVGQSITTISISLTAQVLFVGTENGLIHIYDIFSKQLLRSISNHKGQPITRVASMMKPPDLMGHINLEEGILSRDPLPLKPVLHFQRMRDPKARERHTVSIMLPITEPDADDLDEDNFQAIQEEHAYFTRAPGDSTSSEHSQTQVLALEAQVATLRDQLAKAKGINDAMWEKVVHNVIEGGKSAESTTTPTSNGQREENERGTKRPRKGN
ncbi:WD40 repeat-like protein [Sistotremastrum suecicum HHB10207 ss-3]|uniref:Pre-rRNA-processing protein IPI3 n=1 Tax=Sistotremastrum suecicum HHB10207 ss-3 TaxID=1314776 RepID=A0A166I083_9AGAM|nr:WD40 repeat-like protein [Sistotremastrum suecicum HHB10207 ss-3]